MSIKYKIVKISKPGKNGAESTTYLRGFTTANQNKELKQELKKAKFQQGK